MRVVNRMDRFYSKLVGELGDTLEEKYLEKGWQELATIEGIKPMFWTMQWPKNQKDYAKARFIGGVLGHSVAHYEAMCDPRLWRKVCDGLNTLFELLVVKPDDFEGLDPEENPFVEALPQFNCAVASAMRYPLRQPSGEQVMFFEGYAKALRGGSITLDGKGVGGSTRSSAYQLIAMFGPQLKMHCRSVHDVHRFLERMLGRARAGTIKRTESMCKVIGMRFRGPGRPTPDNRSRR